MTDIFSNTPTNKDFIVPKDTQSDISFQQTSIKSLKQLTHFFPDRLKKVYLYFL